VKNFNRVLISIIERYCRQGLLKNAYNTIYETLITGISMCKCRVFRKNREYPFTWGSPLKRPEMGVCGPIEHPAEAECSFVIKLWRRRRVS
jgi:hypothetical protein